MKNILFILIIFCTAMIISCKKNKATKVDPNEVIIIRDKPIAELRNMLIGTWKIHYSVGGLTGIQKTLTPNSFFKVLANDSVYLTFDNVLSAADKATYTRKLTAFGFSANLITFPLLGGPDREWIFDTMKGDSLGLTGNCLACGYYVMTKLP